MKVDKEKENALTLDSINSCDIPSSEIPSSSRSCKNVHICYSRSRVDNTRQKLESNLYICNL
jgi:hypothetical protein